MRIGRRKAIGAAIAVLIVAAAVSAWCVGGTDLLLAVVLATVMAGMGGVGYLIAQSERRLRAQGVATVDRFDALANELGGRLQRPGEQFEALLRALHASHIRLEGELAASVEASDRELVEELSRVLNEHRVQIAERQDLSDQRMLRQFKHTSAEVDALLQIHRRLELDDPLPIMGGWALSPRGMLQALELLESPNVSLVAECGSGTSTLFLARAMQLKGAGKLISLEHLPVYAEKTRLALENHGLDEVAEVRLAPLEEVSIHDTSYMWYSPSVIADLTSVDVVIVDGPPESTGTWARYPAYPLLRSALSDSAVILVDDMTRDDERAMVDAWLQLGGLVETPGLSPDQVVLLSDD